MYKTGSRPLNPGRPARPYVTAGLTLVGAGALVGSFIVPTPSNVVAARVELAAAHNDAPASNQVLANLPAGGDLATDTSSVRCGSEDSSTALFARIGDVAEDVQGRRVGPEAFIAVASDVVSHIITTPKTGAALTNSALTSTLLDRIAELEASGAMPGSAAAAIRALVGTLSSVTSTGVAVTTNSPGSAANVPGSVAGTWVGTGIGTGVGIGDGLGGGVPSPDTGGGVGTLAAPVGGPATVGRSSFFATPPAQFPSSATGSGGGGGGGSGTLIGSVPNVPGPPNGDLTALLLMLRDRFRDFPGSPESPDLADFAALITLLHTHFPDVDLTAFFAHLRDKFGHVGGSVGDSNDELADFFAHLRDKFGHVGGSVGDSNDELADFFADLHDKFGDLGGSSGVSDHELADFFAHLHDKFSVGGSMEMSGHKPADMFAHLHDKFGDVHDSSGQHDHGLPGWGTIQTGDRIGTSLAGDHSISEGSLQPRHEDVGASLPQGEAQNVPRPEDVGASLPRGEAQNAPRHALPDSSETQQRDQQTFVLPNRVLENSVPREPSNGSRVDFLETPNVGYTPKHSREMQTGGGQASQNRSTDVSTGNLSQPRHAKPSQNESKPAAGSRHVGSSSGGSTGHHKGR